MRVTPRQERFIQLYTSPESSTFGQGKASACAAGYKGPNLAIIANKLLKHPDIAPLVAAERAHHAAEQKKRNEKVYDEFTVLQTLRDFQSMYEEAREKGELRDAIRAKELIGKHLRMFTERLEVDDVSGKSEEDLRMEIDNLMKQLGYH